MPNSERFDLFLSHASEDKEAVRDFVERLRAAGLRPWLDEEQMGPGTKPINAIPVGLEASRHVCIWITEHWLTKRWTTWELELFRSAQDAGRKVINENDF